MSNAERCSVVEFAKNAEPTKGKEDSQMKVRAGWKAGTLQDVICSVRGGFSVRCEDRAAATGELGVLKTGAVLVGKFDPKKNKYVSPEEHARLRTPVSANTIIICRKNSAESIGASALVDRDYRHLFLSDLLWELKPSKDADCHWLANVLKSDFVLSILRLWSTGTQSTMKNISQDRLLAIPISIPKKNEQQKIVAILRTWDEAIENLLRLTELRKTQYLGLRDYLIDWSKNQRAVKEFLKPVSRPVRKPTSGYRALSIRSHGKGTFDRYVEDPECIEMDTLYVVKSGDVIVNITFAWEGAVALVPRDHDGCLVSHRFPTFVPKMERVDARYLRHALRMARFTYLLGIVSPGGAGRNRVLSKSDFLDLMVPLPPLDQQQRIAMILDDAEDAISVEEKYLSALKHQKRGLMQKLLTGEWRVKC